MLLQKVFQTSMIVVMEYRVSANSIKYWKILDKVTSQVHLTMNWIEKEKSRTPYNEQVAKVEI